MSLRRNELPAFNLAEDISAIDWEVDEKIVNEWMALSHNAYTEDAIQIFDIIGDDGIGGISDTQIASQLRARNGQDVHILMNSPGGDVGTGLSIYNLLRNHNAKVTVEVTGYAMSAASVIAMAADELVMADGSIMMIHNAWGMTVGNQYDFVETAEILKLIDGQMASIYAARTGIDEDKIHEMLKAETFMSHKTAVEMGFADSVNAKNKVTTQAKSVDKTPLAKQRRLERALGKLGVPRNRRQEVINLMIDGAPRDASSNTAARDAGTKETVELMKSLAEIFK